MSCCGHIRKLRTFAKKELETLGAAQKLLGAPTISGRSARGGGGGGGSERSQIRPHAMYINSKKMGSFAHFLANESQKMPLYAQKYITRSTPGTFLEEYINFINFHYLRHCGVIHVLEFIYAPSHPD
jgi:hypothetical protein